MMTKQEFERAIGELSELRKKWRTFQSSFDGVTDTHNPIFSTGQDLAIRLLAELMGDEHDTIGFWFYEMDEGRDKRSGIFEKKTKIPMDTAGELYDYLAKNSPCRS
jgi:hypothetical protein